MILQQRHGTLLVRATLAATRYSTAVEKYKSLTKYKIRLVRTPKSKIIFAHLQPERREKQGRERLIEQLELPELDLPVLLHGKLVEGDLCVAGRTLHGVDVVEHVHQHSHLVFLDVPVFLAVEDKKAEPEDVFPLEEAVGGDGVQPLGKRQLLEVPDTCFVLFCFFMFAV